MRTRLPALIAVLALASIAGSTGGSAASSRGRVGDGRAALRSAYLVVAAGDIACASDPGSSPTACRHDDTATLIDGRGIDAVLALGDNQYDVGAYGDYTRYFDPTWGVVKGRIQPVPGNHEYAQDPGATPSGYFRYFGDRVRGTDGLGYYSYDVGACPDAPCWHLIALSSELCFASGGCGRAADPSHPGSGNRMFAWLKADLAAHPNDEYPCTLAYWHHPLFSFSTGSGATQAVRPLWDLLARADADIVLNGHSHNYQRWAPQTPAGAASPTGIREFVVGTGGASHYAIAGGPYPSHLVTAQADAFGVLRLALKATGYRWEWVSAPGQPAFEDAAGRIASCH